MRGKASSHPRPDAGAHTAAPLRAVCSLSHAFWVLTPWLRIPRLIHKQVGRKGQEECYIFKESKCLLGIMARVKYLHTTEWRIGQSGTCTATDTDRRREKGLPREWREAP